MPGVLQIEAMAQTAAPILLTLEQYKGKLALFAGIDGVRFKILYAQAIDLIWKQE